LTFLTFAGKEECRDISLGGILVSFFQKPKSAKDAPKMLSIVTPVNDHFQSRHLSVALVVALHKAVAKSLRRGVR